MQPTSQILDALAAKYESSQAGRTSDAALDFQIGFRSLLHAANATTGDAYDLAVKDLQNAHSVNALRLERHPADEKVIDKIRVPKSSEDQLYQLLARPSPSCQRESLARLFEDFAGRCAHSRHAAAWRSFCLSMALAARIGKSVQPFERKDLQLTHELLALAPKVLDWKRESYLRFASCVLCGSSKRLYELQGRLERILPEVTHGEIKCLSDVGICDTGSGCWLHGPVKLCFKNGALDLTHLSGPVHLSTSDLRRATPSTGASRCLTVENETMLHELAKANEQILLVSSGFRGGVANTAVVNFLRALPQEMEIWHFGDSDPKGFDILRDLRDRTGKSISSLHMNYRPSAESLELSTEDHKVIQRLLASDSITAAEKVALQAMRQSGTKGKFEQESLGHPKADWPFYEAE